MDYISVRQAAVKWGISEGDVQKLLEENRIDGAVLRSRLDDTQVVGQAAGREDQKRQIQKGSNRKLCKRIVYGS